MKKIVIFAVIALAIAAGLWYYYRANAQSSGINEIRYGGPPTRDYDMSPSPALTPNNMPSSSVKPKTSTRPNPYVGPADRAY